MVAKNGILDWQNDEEVMTVPKALGGKEAITLLQRREPIRDRRISGDVVVPPDDFAGRVDCKRVHFDSFTAICTLFHEPVRFVSCHFEHLDFYAAYFLQGLLMAGCTVGGRLQFQSGGHNDDGPVQIFDTQFNGFVDFEDCWFTGPVQLRNVSFNAGTNLLGNANSPVSAKFDVGPELEGVVGALDSRTFRT